MAVRDIVVLNTTASRLEAQQSSDTVRISGTSDQLISIENSSDTAVFSLHGPSSSISITGHLTASGDFSASLGNVSSSTASSSFGRIEATTLVGSAANLTNTDWELGIVSSSQQIASEISGAFSSGFEFTGNIVKSVGVWSAGGAIINGKNERRAGAGLQNAGIIAGGSSTATETEEYNGSAWSAGGALIIGRDAGTAIGTVAATLMVGGTAPAATGSIEEYNGAAWAVGGS